MTVRDIQGHLADIYDIEVSADLISKITDAVLEEVKDWQSRPLEPGQFPLVAANPGLKGFGCPGTHITRCRLRSGAATSS